jgi:hypothetical protein
LNIGLRAYRNSEATAGAMSQRGSNVIIRLRVGNVRFNPAMMRDAGDLVEQRSLLSFRGCNETTTMQRS